VHRRRGSRKGFESIPRALESGGGGGERRRDVRGNCWRNNRAGRNKTRQTGGRKKETVWAGNEIASELSPGKSIFLMRSSHPG
jgi:hypothetical protein